MRKLWRGSWMVAVWLAALLAAVVVVRTQSPASPAAERTAVSSTVKASGASSAATAPASKMGKSVATLRVTARGLGTAGGVAAPEEVGLSSERLERIAGAIDRSIDAGQLAGAVALVARHGKIAYFKALGMADREAKKPMRTDNIFRICSMSKPITSVAVMILYEEGRFMLNEPVSDFIPEFKNMKVLDPPYPQDKTSPPGALVDAKRPITIFDLLTHTSGLTYPWNARLGKIHARRHRYGAASAGRVHRGFDQEAGLASASVSARRRLGIQLGGRCAGLPGGEGFGNAVRPFLEERIFKPLGMKDSGFFLPER